MPKRSRVYSDSWMYGVIHHFILLHFTAHEVSAVVPGIVERQRSVPEFFQIRRA